MRYMSRTSPCPGFFISIISGAALPELLHHRPQVVLGHVDGELLVRLEALAVDAGLDDHARPRHLELVSLAPHGLHEDREVELAAPRHLPRVGRVGVLDAERDVALELLVQPVAHLPRRDVLPFLAGEGRVVDDEVDRDGRLLDADPLEALGVLGVGDRRADLDAFEAGQRDDLAGGRGLDLDALEPSCA
jgi:hypothetical protein